jgi:hypothetical protein
MMTSPDFESSRRRVTVAASLVLIGLALAATADADPKGKQEKGGKKTFQAYNADPEDAKLSTYWPLATASQVAQEQKDAFAALCMDPAHGNAISDPNIREAMAGLTAVSKTFIVGPLKRGPAEIEFYDSAGHPYDVKAPPSPPPGAKWKFNAVSAGKSIIKQLMATAKNGNLDSDVAVSEPVTVIFDSTYLNDTDHKAVWDYLTANSGPASMKLLDNLIEVQTPLKE